MIHGPYNIKLTFYYIHIKESVSRYCVIRIVGRLLTRRPAMLVRFLAGSSVLSFVQSVQIVSRGKAVGGVEVISYTLV